MTGSPPSPARFASLLGGLDRRAFAAFLTAVWRARGREARVTPDGDVAVEDGPRLRPHVGSPLVPDRLTAAWLAREDAVVATTSRTVAARLRDRDRAVVGPDDVRRALLYDCDRDTADALVRDHLDRSLAGEPTRGGRSVTAVVLAVVAVVAVAGGAVVLQPTAPTPAGSASTAPPATASTDAPTRSPPTATVPADGVTGGGVGGKRVAPGLVSSGVEDLDALATAHERATATRSYAWTFSARRRDRDDRSTVPAAWFVTARVATPTTYRVEVRSWGDPPFVPAGVDVPDSAVVYADGTRRYARSDGRVTAGPAASVDETTHASDHVRGLLDAARTDVTNRTVRDGTVRYRVDAVGSPRVDWVGYEATAFVTPEGFVREARATYRPRGSDDVVVVRFRYGAVNRTTVTPPAWYDRARNRTT